MKGYAIALVICSSVIAAAFLLWCLVRFSSKKKLQQLPTTTRNVTYPPAPRPTYTASTSKPKAVSSSGGGVAGDAIAVAVVASTLTGGCDAGGTGGGDGGGGDGGGCGGCGGCGG